MRRFKGPNDVEEARQAVHKVLCSFIQVFVVSFLGIHVHVQLYSCTWRVILYFFYLRSQKKKAQPGKIVDSIQTPVPSLQRSLNKKT